MNGIEVTEVEKQKMIELYKQGMILKDIGIETGYALSTVFNYIPKQIRRSRRTIPQAIRDEAYRLYNVENKTSTEIAKMLGICITSANNFANNWEGKQHNCG